jgi:alpha-beta hydrolase superfamily lysophospholipase
VLLFYGLLDEWSPVSPSVDVWRAVQSEEIEIVLIPEAGHDMTVPNGALAPEYESRMVQWLLSR